MAYRTEINNISDSTDKESWQRSTHILNIITLGQTLMITGELQQNPFYIYNGCIIILDTIGPFYKVKGEEKEGKKTTTYGIETSTYKQRLQKLSEAKSYINLYLKGEYNNAKELLEESYNILNSVKAELLQDVDDMNLNFKAKRNPSNLYLEEKK